MDRTKEIREAVVEQAVDGEPHDQRWTTGQAGSGSFPELVRAHFDWERAGCSDGADEQRYRQRLREFEAREGEVSHVYWATRRPSAVALTVKPKTGLAGLVSDHDALIRLHRVTDWLVRERRIADLLHHCDTLAIKVSQVLRGTPERIAMQWLYAVQSHLLGFTERMPARVDEKQRAVVEKQITAVVESQKRELIQIEKYYTGAAEKAARIVYFWGMMIGAVFSTVLLFVLAGGLLVTDWFEQPHTREVQTFFVSYIAGGVGAIVSVLMRMSSNKFRVDFEVGRATVLRLGSFRPFIGVVFGIALYFLLLSDIFPQLNVPDDSTEFFFFGIVAFLAGFNERWTNVLFGQAERTIAASLGERPAQANDEEEDRP